MSDKSFLLKSLTAIFVFSLITIDYLLLKKKLIEKSEELTNEMKKINTGKQ